MDIQRVLVHSKEECCGCGLCAEVCPKHAIDMKEDILGFNYPVINKDICIECMACVNNCILNTKSSKTERIKNYE